MKQRSDPLKGMAIEQLETQVADWEENELEEFLSLHPESKEEFETFSGLPLKRVYTALEASEKILMYRSVVATSR